jgi:hypothetical protein
MVLEGSTAAPFPRRFVLQYSFYEARRNTDRRSRGQRSLARPGRTWTRLIILALVVSGFSLLGRASGALSASGVPLVAALLSGAFIAGVFAGWMEIGSMSKHALSALHAQGSKGFGPWDMVVTDEALAGTSQGWSFRLDLADVRDIALDDLFVILVVDPTLDFAVPKRCLGDGAAAEAFKAFVEARRAGSEPSSRR